MPDYNFHPVWNMKFGIWNGELSSMNLQLPEIYNAATTFVDDNIKQGRGGKVAIYYQDQKITYQEVFEKVTAPATR